MKYVLYTNTDYLDVAKVHSDYLKFNDNILVINSNNLALDDFYHKFQEVIFYDDRLPYAGRLYQSLKQIDSDYVLLIHDMDIPLNIDVPFINKLLDYAKDNYIERIDLQHENDAITDKSIIVETDTFQKISKNEIGNYKTSLVRSYFYNVNPSIWHRQALMDILFHFANETYRTIENKRVDKFCEKYSMYKLYTTNIVHSGYYNVTEEFKFLHITHGGYLLPDNYEALSEKVPINLSVLEEYRSILSKYSFNRGIRQKMW